jgi:hypothetical protein
LTHFGLAQRAIDTTVQITYIAVHKLFYCEVLFMKYRLFGSIRPKASLPLAALMIPLIPMSGTAAPRHKKVASKETYAALDANEMQPGFAMPTEIETSSLGTLNKGKRTAPAPQTAPKKQAMAPKRAPSAKAAAFDSVPASQSDAILQRLKIVENLVRKHSRAYDYRTLTLKELQQIESSLNSSKVRAELAAPAVAAPPVVAPQKTEPSDSVGTSQSAPVEENAEDVKLNTLPDPEIFEPTDVDADN